jgi:hypothetical protein
MVSRLHFFFVCSLRKITLRRLIESPVFLYTTYIMTTRTKKDFSAKDFPLDTKLSNVSEITLSTRYPESGYALNTVSEMVVYILKGEIALTQNVQERIYSKGEVALVKANAKYFWVPQKSATLLIFSTPPWTPEQQKLFDK